VRLDHRLEELFESAGRRAIDFNEPIFESTEAPSNWRALAMVLGDFSRAWRDVREGDTSCAPSDLRLCGGADGNRTHDPLLAKQVL
jgi:hypothetical protein